MLVDVAFHTPSNSTLAANISSSTATWSYDDVTGLLTQTGGTFSARFSLSPVTTLYRHTVTGLVIGAGGTAAGTSFVCAEGNFGVTVGASLCGNYLFGANYINESTATWGPGLAFSRTFGGDDVPDGPPQQSIAVYDGFTMVSWVGTTLTLTNAACNPVAPGGNDCDIPGFLNQGYTWTLQTPVPVPAAAWLFGGALAGLGLLRRRSGP